MSALNPSGPSMGLDPSKTTPIVCKCGNHTFVHGAFLRHVSAIVHPEGKEGFMPMPTLVCNACGAVPDEIVPSFMKEEADKKDAPAPSKLTLVP
jgi:hypothetical protein